MTLFGGHDTHPSSTSELLELARFLVRDNSSSKRLFSFLRLPRLLCKLNASSCATRSLVVQKDKRRV